MRYARIVVAALALVAVPTLSAVSADARPPGWVKLGERTVTDRVDRDVIVVTASRGDWSAVKLTVRRRPVELREVEIHFANGGVQDVAIRRVIPAGGETRVIDLVGDDRVIQRIELTYDAQSIGGRAVVRAYGRR